MVERLWTTIRRIKNLLSLLVIASLVAANFDDSVPQVGKDIIVTGALSAGGFITIEKKAQVSGIRIESDEEGFVGYSKNGISIVQPDHEVRIVIFGWWLDEVVTFGFTSEGNCNQTLSDVNNADFTFQTERRVVFEYQFIATHSFYKICMRQKPRETKTGELLPSPYVLVDDLRAMVSTDIPPREYYFPMHIQITIILFLLVLSGLFSGLNLGLMALTPQELFLISKSGSEQEKKYAEMILPIRKSGNNLLCSLLIGNVMVNSAISILFDDLTSGYIALFTSSAGIVVFGEIFPQSLCVKKGLAVGAHTIWITRFFMVLTFPLAYPISRLLDCILGDEVVAYDRKRLMELIKMSTRDKGLAEEFKIAVGAMEISDKTVEQVMTKINDVFMLPSSTILNTLTVAEILRMGYTRIPVYEDNRNNVVSLLFVKDLALLDPDDNFTVKTVCGYHDHKLRFVMNDTPLRVMLEEFKKGEYHLALVQKIADNPSGDPVRENVGVVTLEDIVEEILQAEIVDETDVIVDNVSRNRRREREDIARILVSDNNAYQISVQMQFVTMQWLTANIDAFGEAYVNRGILEKIIRQHVVKVDNIQHFCSQDSKQLLKRQKVYEKGVPSDKFVLILEGRMMVKIGQNEMTFEAGPWHSFGVELLERIRIDAQSNLPAPPTAVTTPIVVPPPAVAVAALPGAQGLELDKAYSFRPDFSATIYDDCTYLEVSAQTYLLAYKSTLISRSTKAHGDDQTCGSNNDLSFTPKGNLTGDHIKEEDDLNIAPYLNGELHQPRIRAVRKRSQSDSSRPTSPPLAMPEKVVLDMPFDERSPLTAGDPDDDA